MLSRGSSDSSLSYELTGDNCVWEYFKSAKIPGWQCHTSPILGIYGSLLPHFAPLMIFPESVTGFSELKASPLPGLWNFFLARGQDCSLPVTQSWQEGRDFLKNTLHVSSWASYPRKLCCLASGTGLGIEKGKREVNSRYLQICSWSWPWWG